MEGTFVAEVSGIDERVDAVIESAVALAEIFDYVTKRNFIVSAGIRVLNDFQKKFFGFLGKYYHVVNHVMASKERRVDDGKQILHNPSGAGLACKGR